MEANFGYTLLWDLSPYATSAVVSVLVPASWPFAASL